MRSETGRAGVRVAPPDSLPPEYARPFNWGAGGAGGGGGSPAGAAVVVGDSTVWADPEKNFRSLVPAVRMLWAGLGIVRPPALGAGVFGLAMSGPDSARIWRFVQGEDTLDYRLARGGARVLEAEWRRQGKVVARRRAEVDVRAMPASGRTGLPQGPARFEFTVGSVDTMVAFDSATWRRRH